MLKHVRAMAMVQPVRLPGFRRLFVGESIAVFADQMLLVSVSTSAAERSVPLSR